MELKMHIHKIKCIDDMDIKLSVDKGLYAITGLNGSGKSTVAACASSVFYNMQMNEYFGPTSPDSTIQFEFNGATKTWYKEYGRLWRKKSNGYVNVNGFFEGSLIYGNRFRDTSFDKVKKVERVDTNTLTVADDFIRKNLGRILQGNENYYDRLFYLQNSSLFKGDIFFYEKNGKRVSQFHMSTGENLLISILNSLLMRIQDQSNAQNPCLVILDEIELALHPSSLKRLLQFMEDISNRYNYAIYFSTHSLELISNISPSNIIYIERHADNKIEVISPCYPAYATRILYEHSGFDHIILVEDDLAAGIVKRIIDEQQLYSAKMVHVLPCGGYPNVLKLADEVIRYKILGKLSSICIILDGDVQTEALAYMRSHSITINVPLKFLPIESLEKYLREKLYVNVDTELFRLLTDYIFQMKSITEIITDYEAAGLQTNDANGKKFFDLLEVELKERRVSRDKLIEMVVNYNYQKNDVRFRQITNFLITQLTR